MYRSNRRSCRRVVPAWLLLAAVWTIAAAAPAGPLLDVVDPADVGRPSLRIFTGEDGLPQNAIAALAVAGDHTIWAGTKDGAAYFDGRVWRAVPIPSEVGSNWVQEVLPASDGAVWFGTLAGGVARLRDGVWSHFDQRNGLPGNEVRCLLETASPSGERQILVGTTRGLVRYESDTWTPVDLVPGDGAVAVLALYERVTADEVREVWVGTERHGIVRLREGQRTNFSVSEAGMLSNHVISFAETTVIDGQPTLVAGVYGSGLARFDGERWVHWTGGANGVPEGVAACMIETREPNGSPTLWVGSAFGLDRYRGGRWTRFTTKNGLSLNGIWSLVATRSESGTRALWIGTSGGGVVRWHLGKWIAFDERAGMPDNSVYGVLVTQAADGAPVLWVGTSEGGLGRLERGQWTSFNFDSGFPAYTVWSLLETEDRDGGRSIWVGTNQRGLVRIQGTAQRLYTTADGLPGPAVFCLYETRAPDGESTVWVGTDLGFARLVDGEIVPVDPRLALPDARVRCFLETDAGDGTKVLWVGTEGGLVRFDRGVATSFTVASGLPNNAVLSLHERRSEDGRRELWVGTRGGIARFDPLQPDRPWRYLTTETELALPNNTIYQIREDRSGRIYLFTNKGIARLTPQRAPEAPEFSSYVFTTEDGLPSNECNTGASTVDFAGRIWAGTIKGVAVLDPTREIPDVEAKPLVVQRAFLKGADQRLVSGASLAYDANNIVIEYALLSHFREEQVRYRTQLIGFDEQPSEWVADSKREFTSLPAGSYRFLLWGRDAAGNVSGPVELAFVIRPAPWATWWAIALYALLLGGAIYAGVRYRMRTLRLRNEMLQSAITERTTELAAKVDDLYRSERKALESERHALEANRAKSTFLANMSHELRTPLNAILGFVQLLERDAGLRREQREALSIITRSGEHLLGLINDVLSIAKIEAGQLVLAERRFDLHRLLDAVREMMLVRAEARGLHLEFDLAQDLPQIVLGDEGKLRQVLINLLGNAVKFTREGRIDLRARAEGERVRFEIQDTGPGIAESERDQLFEAFSQTSSGHRVQEGTGLGLFISRQIVRLMGGEIEVSSVVGQGTTFTFEVELPAADGTEAVASEPRRVVGLAPGQSTVRVLVVDDIYENRLLVTRFLSSIGFAVGEAINGAEAVDLWEAWHPHLIWMDVRMPVMGGLEATREIRRREEARHAGGAPTRIVALTASAFEHDRENLIAAGCNDFVTKPVLMSTLLEKSAELLGVRYVYEEPETPVVDEQVPGDTLAPERLARVAGDVVAQLEKMLVIGDVSGALDVAGRVAAEDRALGAELVGLVRAYRFDDLLEAVARSRGAVDESLGEGVETEKPLGRSSGS